MNLTNSPNTCSMTELSGIYAETAEAFATHVKALIKQAHDNSRKMIIANMHEETSERFGKELKAAGFVFVGRYKGNSAPWVYTWMHGLEDVPKPVVLKKKRIRRVKSALSAR
jgi:hypothetical protein